MIKDGFWHCECHPTRFNQGAFLVQWNAAQQMKNSNVRTKCALVSRLSPSDIVGRACDNLLGNPCQPLSFICWKSSIKFQTEPAVPCEQLNNFQAPHTFVIELKPVTPWILTSFMGRTPKTKDVSTKEKTKQTKVEESTASLKFDDLVTPMFVGDVPSFAVRLSTNLMFERLPPVNMAGLKVDEFPRCSLSTTGRNQGGLYHVPDDHWYSLSRVSSWLHIYIYVYIHTYILIRMYFGSPSN